MRSPKLFRYIAVIIFVTVCSPSIVSSQVLEQVDSLIVVDSLGERVGKVIDNGRGGIPEVPLKVGEILFVLKVLRTSFVGGGLGEEVSHGVVWFEDVDCTGTAFIEPFRQPHGLPDDARIIPQAAIGTINNDHTILKHMLSLAVKRGILEVNVAKKVPLPNPNNERDRVLSQEEWSRLYKEAAPHLKPILLVAYHLGLRLGEILELTWERVDMRRGFIHLRSQDTKTSDSRLIPLTPPVWESLTELSKVRRLTTNRVFLFEGKPVQGIKRAFHSAKRKAQIENLRFHDLRHCAATNLRRAGVDTVTAMKIVGHKSEKMHRRYNNVSEADLLAAASKINTYLTPTDSTIPSTAISYLSFLRHR